MPLLLLQPLKQQLHLLKLSQQQLLLHLLHLHLLQLLPAAAAAAITAPFWYSQPNPREPTRYKLRGSRVDGPIFGARF